MKFNSLFNVALLAQQILAHPGQSAEEHAKEVAERRAYLSSNKRSLDHCAAALTKRGNAVAMHQRRAAHIEKLRAKRTTSTELPSHQARDLESVLGTNHHSNLTGVTVNSDPNTLFSGNNSCVLSPEVTQGPYWVSGEYVRQNITDGQDGVPLTLDIQIIDVDTCEPVPEAFLEIWHCNSTGVYSGVVASGNGNQNDTSNLDKTFLRGIQKSDNDGVVTFDTLFPGHYTGRATHIHVMTSQNATLNSNETLTGGSITHVGQMFFDQGLISLVEEEAPYTTNTQALTENADDMILGEEAETTDPFIEYVLLGDSVSDGVFGWLAFGMNTSASYNVSAAASLTESGGVENENSGGMGGGPPGGAGRPSGVAGPTGTLAVSNATISSTMAVVSSSSATSLAVWRLW